MENVYIIGAFIFVACALSEGLKKALIVTFCWLAFWKLFEIIFMSVGKTGETIMAIAYAVFVLGGFVLWASGRR